MTDLISSFEWPGRSGMSTIAPLSGTTVTLTLSPTLTRARSIKAASKIMPCEFPTLVIVLVMCNTMFYAEQRCQLELQPRLRTGVALLATDLRKGQQRMATTVSLSE